MTQYLADDSAYIAQQMKNLGLGGSIPEKSLPLPSSTESVKSTDTGWTILSPGAVPVAVPELCLEIRADRTKAEPRYGRDQWA